MEIKWSRQFDFALRALSDFWSRGTSEVPPTWGAAVGCNWVCFGWVQAIPAGSRRSLRVLPTARRVRHAPEPRSPRCLLSSAFFKARMVSGSVNNSPMKRSCMKVPKIHPHFRTLGFFFSLSLSTSFCFFLHNLHILWFFFLKMNFLPWSFYLQKSQSLVAQTFSPIHFLIKRKKKKRFHCNSLRESLMGSASVPPLPPPRQKIKPQKWDFEETHPICSKSH